MAKELARFFTDEIRLVSRNPKKVNEADRLMAADLTQGEAVRKAVEGSSVVYVTIGFPYRYSVWQREWPAFISNVIAACKEFQAKLVFFDNAYMYDENHLDGMTEDTPINPPSKKGRIRAEIAQMIMHEVGAGNLTALIARSADFYGPGVKNGSLINETIIKPLSKGREANLIGWENYKHTFTYTPDAGKATALLGNVNDAYNQVWHLPTDHNPYTGREWVEWIAGELRVAPLYRNVPKTFLKMMGWFSPTMREIVEMSYQYDRHYVFKCKKFINNFGSPATPYMKGILEMMKHYKRGA